MFIDVYYEGMELLGGYLWGVISYWCELASHTPTGILVLRDLLESCKFFSIWAVAVPDREYFGKYHFYNVSYVVV